MDTSTQAQLERWARYPMEQEQGMMAVTIYSETVPASEIQAGDILVYPHKRFREVARVHPASGNYVDFTVNEEDGSYTNFSKRGWTKMKRLVRHVPH